MKTVFPIRAVIAFTGVFFFLSAWPAFADEILSVNVNTGGLGAGNSEVFFFLTGVAGNTATMTNFSLAAGTAAAIDSLNTSGSGINPANGLGSSIVLNDSSNFLNEFAQSFTAGDALSFTLDLTTNVALPNPDQFSFAIVDPAGNPIHTSDPTGFDNLLAINIDSLTARPNLYSNLVTITTPTPEPGSISLIGVALLGAAVRYSFLLKH